MCSKADFFRRFYADEFGNRCPIWFDYDQWARIYWCTAKASAESDARFMIRSQRPGGLMLPNLQPYEVANAWLTHGSREQMSISLMSPHHRQTINGELSADHRGLCLFYSHVREPMRSSLAKGGRQVYGLRARHVLEHELHEPSDLDHLYRLLACYPGHVIEFTAFEVCWGTVPRSKCVIWEVRKYLWLLMIFGMSLGYA